MKMGSQYLVAGREEVATEVFVSSLWATDASGTGAASLKIPRLHFTSRDLHVVPCRLYSLLNTIIAFPLGRRR